MRRYLDALYHYADKPTGNGYAYNNSIIYVWSQKVWIFDGKALVTVLNLPNRYKNVVNGMGRKADGD